MTAIVGFGTSTGSMPCSTDWYHADCDDGTEVSVGINGYGEFFVEISVGRSHYRCDWLDRSATERWWAVRAGNFDPVVRNFIATHLPFLATKEQSVGS